MYLLPDRLKASKRKTTVKKSTLDPVYEETFRVCSFFSCLFFLNKILF